MARDAQYRAEGRLVMRGHQIIADAISEAVAEEIAAALSIPEWLDKEADRLSGSRSTARALRAAADNLRAQFHRPDVV